LNMRYLPPITEIGGVDTPIRSFNKWTRRSSDSDVLDTSRLRNVLGEIDKYKSEWKVSDDPSSGKKNAYKRFMIGSNDSDSYKAYNLLGQIFVKKQDSLKKYLIIDAGEFFDEENEPVCQVYYAGFVYKDATGVTKFSNEFTILFHNGGID